MAGSNLESWGTAAPVDLRQVAVTDALVETGTGQTGVALGQHFSVHVSWGNATQIKSHHLKNTNAARMIILAFSATTHLCIQTSLQAW